ncbi:hypothetical protein ACVWXP_003828 [Bradyrhizobium sp. USDA 4463]
MQILGTAFKCSSASTAESEAGTIKAASIGVTIAYEHNFVAARLRLISLNGLTPIATLDRYSAGS